MSDKDNNLRSILTDVVGDTTGNAGDTTGQDTNAGSSADASGDTTSGDTPKQEFVGGIDISDIPEQDRPRIKELLTKKLSLAEKGINEKNQSINAEKKAIEAKQKELDELIAKMRSTNPQTQEKAKSTGNKMLDKLIESAPIEQQPALQQMRQIIHEETDTEELRQQLKEISEFVKVFAQDKTISRQGQVKSELEGLRGRYGELVDKYGDEIVKQGLKFNANARQLLHAIVPPDELEQALLKPVKKETTTKEKINAVSSSGSGITSSRETLDTKRPLKGLIKDLMKS